MYLRKNALQESQLIPPKWKPRLLSPQMPQHFRMRFILFWTPADLGSSPPGAGWGPTGWTICGGCGATVAEIAMAVGGW